MKTILGSSFFTRTSCESLYIVMLDTRSWMLAKKGMIPYPIPAKDGISVSLQQVSRNQYPVFWPNEAQTSLYGDETVNPKNIILRAINIQNI